MMRTEKGIHVYFTYELPRTCPSPTFWVELIAIFFPLTSDPWSCTSFPGLFSIHVFFENEILRVSPCPTFLRGTKNSDFCLIDTTGWDGSHKTSFLRLFFRL